MFQLKCKLPTPVYEGAQACSAKFSPNGKRVAVTTGTDVAVYDVDNPSFKPKTAYGIAQCLVGSEMCIRDRAMSSGVE